MSMETNSPTQESTLNQFSQQPIPEQPMKQKGFLLPIIGVVLLLVIIGAGAYYLGISKSSDNPTTENVTSTLSTQPTSAPNDETEKWNTYKNPEGYFTVKYPPTLLSKEEKAGVNSACETSLVLADKASGFSKEYQGDITIDVCQVAEEFYPKAAFSNIEDGDIQSITIDGVKGYKKTGQADLAKLGSKVRVTRVALNFKNKEYTLDLRYIPNHPDYEQAFNQILSTFKFTQ